MPDRLLV